MNFKQKLKIQVYKVIGSEEKDYLPSKLFDLIIMILIILNIGAIFVETFSSLSKIWYHFFREIEIIIVFIFTIEYILRLWVSDLEYKHVSKTKARFKQASSFISIVDLLAILPFYVLLFFPSLSALKMLKLLRLLRILKFNRYTKALSKILVVFKRKSAQLISTGFVVIMLMLISSVLMYYLEHDAQPQIFKNAFSGLWWAVSTFSTVGYGDIYPITIAGKIVSSIVAMLGIALVAIPTGIISAGFMEGMEIDHKNKENHDKNYCHYCGKKLEE